MPYIEVWVDEDDIIKDITKTETEDLIAELESRGWRCENVGLSTAGRPEAIRIMSEEKECRDPISGRPVIQ